MSLPAGIHILKDPEAVAREAAERLIVACGESRSERIAICLSGGSAFGLSEGERNFLVAAPQGQGLLLVGGERAALKVVTSQLEHGLCVTDPAAQLVAVNR